MNVVAVQKIRDTIKKHPLLESFFYFLYRFFFFPISEKKIITGFCTFCGKNTFFLVSSLYRKKTIKLIDPSIFRETGVCLLCSANNRRRFVGELIKKIIIIKLFTKDLDKNKLKSLINKFDLSKYSLRHILDIIKLKDFWIFEPGSYGSIHNILKKHPKYIFSEYFPDPNLKPGQLVGGIRFENLQSLSFKDNSLDLIISLDVFEHIEKPYMAFKEIYRVLKPNGIHIFTVPLDLTNTKHLFDDYGNPLYSLIYHEDPLRSEGALVYTQFGIDIVDILDEYNFSSFIISPKINPKLGIFSKVRVIISIKKAV